MYVRKFEADTIEEALREIKKELGPDAVILKTITNKGLKGAFKKNKIEITAAISEKSYVKKAQVDQVLSTNQKDEFYNGSASYIANMIDQHDSINERKRSNTQATKPNGLSYGSLGLNKSVSSTKNLASNIKNGLDEFLSLGEKEHNNSKNEFDFEREFSSGKKAVQSPIRKDINEQSREMKKVHTYEDEVEVRASRNAKNEFTESSLEKIDELEKKLFELSKSFERIHKKEPIGIYQLRTTLRSLDINEVYIQELIRKGLFELNDSDVENADIVFEFALREMMNSIHTGMPLFSSTDTSKTSTITVFLSAASTGQSSMVQKIAAIKKDSIIVRNTNSINGNSKTTFTEKIFDLNIVKTSTIAEMVSECRKASENGKSVFIDYKCNETEINETKKFIDGLRRAFPNVEVLITLCAIHTELYNRKVLGTYRRLSDGIVISHLDSCLNFGSLFNIATDVKEIPFKFYGTGEVVPDDLEAATSERLMAGIFKLT
jgi:flagellar biosynthesis GTPase FlhF